MSQAIRTGLQRLTYAAMSILLAWHTFAMVIGPAPESPATDVAHALAQPYLTLFGLQHPWDFFAPTVDAGYHFSYVIEDNVGAKRIFTPADRLNNLHPTSIWMKDRYTKIMSMPKVYGDAAGAALCFEHASLNPVSVTLLENRHQDFGPGDLLSGKHASDAEFVRTKTLRTVTCPGR
jgi:hypothetical protein